MMPINQQLPRGALLSLWVVVSALLAVLAVTAWAAGIHEIRFGVVTAGGGTSTQGNQTLVGTIGQPVAGFSSGGPLTLRSGHFQVKKGQVSGVSEGGSTVPSVNTLHDPYPNPFNPMTNVSFDLVNSGDVRLRVFNSRGQQVRDLVQGTWPAGRHLVQWDGKTDQGATASSGVYFLQFESAGVVETKKMTLLK